MSRAVQYGHYWQPTMQPYCAFHHQLCVAG
jgi:hypothetical protein